MNQLIETKKDFTSKQNELLYDLIRKYGGDDKIEFKRELKSFLLYDRLIFKNRIFAKLKEIL